MIFVNKAKHLLHMHYYFWYVFAEIFILTHDIAVYKIKRFSEFSKCSSESVESQPRENGCSELVFGTFILEN